VRKQLALIGGCVLMAAGLAGAIPAVSAAQSGKLVVIMEENETYDSIVGNSQAPYLNKLISQGELLANFTGIADGSHPNYIAQTSGLSPSQSPPTPNIFQAIDGTGGGLTWKEFMESAPGNCANGTSTNIPGTSVPLYTADHDPAYAYLANTTCNANDVPMTTSTFNPASLPSFSYIVPNQCDDMHTLPGSGQACPAYFGSNTGSNLISMGDNWLATVVPQLLAQPGVTVLITWDEGSVSTTPPEHLAAVEVGAGVTPGSTDGTAYNHYGIEAGLYKYFGLGPAPNNGATATPVPFGGPAPSPSPSMTSPSPTPTSPSPSPTGTCSGGITVDPSSPAVVHGSYGVSSVSTASFSPPAGSLLEVMVDALHGGVTVTLADSKGGTYTAGPHIQGTTQAGSVYFFQRYLPSAPGSMTVTASQSGSLATISLAVQVLDNAAQVQTGAASATTTSSGTSQYGSLTTTQKGSWAYAVMGTGDATETVTPLSTTSNVDVWNDSSQSGNLAAMGRSASATGTPAATNFGWTGNHSDNFVWAAQEVLPASC
jgi:phosphatidylinositol-3-phosphatase